jgi:hypothetical protein
MKLTPAQQELLNDVVYATLTRGRRYSYDTNPRTVAALRSKGLLKKRGRVLEPTKAGREQARF